MTDAGYSTCPICGRTWLVKMFDDCLLPVCGCYGKDTSANNPHRPCERCGIEHAMDCSKVESNSLEVQFRRLRVLIEHQFELEKALIREHGEEQVTVGRLREMLKDASHMMLNKGCCSHCFPVLNTDTGFWEHTSECELGKEIKNE